MTEIKVQSVLEDYQMYLSNIPNGLVSLIALFRNNQKSEALKILSDFSEGLLWLEKASEYLKTSNIEIEYDIQKVILNLEEINEALQSEDFLLVADILEYELLEYFTNLTKN